MYKPDELTANGDNLGDYAFCGAYGAECTPSVDIENINPGQSVTLPMDTKVVYQRKGFDTQYQFSDYTEVTRGKNGVIYQATLDTKQLVALKSPLKQQENELLNEIRVYQQLEQMSHGQNNLIAELLCAFRINQSLRAAFPFYERGNLAQLIQNKPLSTSERNALMMNFAQCVAFIHQCGLIHGDLKADNVLVDKHGRLRLSDMGNAHFITEEKRGFGGVILNRSPKMLLNTRAYEMRKKEQLAPYDEGLEHIRPADDVYSAALVLFHIATSSLPYAHYYKSKDLSEFMNRLIDKNQRLPLKSIENTSPNVANIIGTMWHQNEKLRPTMSEVVSQLEPNR